MDASITALQRKVDTLQAQLNTLEKYIRFKGGLSVPQAMVGSDPLTQGLVTNRIAGPQGNLTVYGGLSLFQTNVTLANGANANVNIANSSFIAVTGPTLAFAISGFQNGAPGRILVVLNLSGQQMTLTNNALSTVNNRIRTTKGADVVFAAHNSLAVLIWEIATGTGFWTLVAANGADITT